MQMSSPSNFIILKEKAFKLQGLNSQNNFAW